MRDSERQIPNVFRNLKRQNIFCDLKKEVLAFEFDNKIRRFFLSGVIDGKHDYPIPISVFRIVGTYIELK